VPSVSLLASSLRSKEFHAIDGDGTYFGGLSDHKKTVGRCVDILQSEGHNGINWH
jgi:hypothetical protein